MKVARPPQAVFGTPLLWASIPPSWEQIRPVRELLAELTTLALGKEAADNATMVANELLENAVKYGVMSSRVEVAAAHDSSAAELQIQVSNEAHPSRIQLLERELGRDLDQAPQAAFQRAVNRLAKLPAGATMLGLARIRTQASLSLVVESPRVTLIAVLAARRRGPERPRSGPTDEATPPSGGRAAGSSRAQG